MDMRRKGDNALETAPARGKLLAPKEAHHDRNFQTSRIWTTSNVFQLDVVLCRSKIDSMPPKELCKLRAWLRIHLLTFVRGTKFSRKPWTSNTCTDLVCVCAFLSSCVFCFVSTFVFLPLLLLLLLLRWHVVVVHQSQIKIAIQRRNKKIDEIYTLCVCFYFLYLNWLEELRNSADIPKQIKTTAPETRHDRRGRKKKKHNKSYANIRVRSFSFTI